MMKRILLLGAALLLGMLVVGCGSTQPPQPAGNEKGAVKVESTISHRFILAGSGTNLPITEKLAEAYKKKTGAPVEVAKSIGSDGAVKAVSDGTLALGLLSRPLTETEKSAGLRTLPYAKVGIVFAVHPSVPESNVTFEDILAIHRGEKTLWADGKRILVLIRGMHDSSNQILFTHIPGFAEVIQDSIEKKRWLVMYHDIDMANALRTKEGSFGHTDTTELKVRGGIKALAVNNVAPTAENMKSGKYPLVKELSFVYKGELPPQYKAFIEFVRSADGEAIIRDNGGAAMP